MKMKSVQICGAVFLYLGIIFQIHGAGTQEPAGEGDREVRKYMMLIPKTLTIGESGTVQFNLMNKNNGPGSSAVEAALGEIGGSPFVRTQANIDGTGSLEVPVPAHLDPGEYTLSVFGESFSETKTVTLQEKKLLFLESDKPIYKPGQMLRLRIISCNSSLRPSQEEITIEALDAKGIKIFRKAVTTDEFGTVSLDLPISREPNEGVWKLSAFAGDRTARLDVRVEKYTLPKYEVSVDFPKEWFLASEPIRGGITAEYSFGKPVKGNGKSMQQ